jgi:hypothetical protein
VGGTRAQANFIRWFAPGGTGNGESSNSPMTLNYVTFTNLLRSRTNQPTVIFKLLPSTNAYEIDRVLVIPDEIGVGILTNLNLTIEGLGATPDAVRLVNVAVKGTYRNPDYILQLDRTVEQSFSPPNNKIKRMAARVVIENLLLDGNWQWKMDQYDAPAYAEGYKNAPLLVTASTGKIRKVIVRNFGAVGYVPWSHFGGVAGVETFPVRVGGDDVGQVPPAGQRRPWEVLDCEVHGFNGEYAGYTTEVMVGPNYSVTTNGYTPEWARTNVNRRFAVVRNVQYRSESDGAFIIAMGNAAYPHGPYDSGRTTFADSVVLNTSLGYNVDTGKVVGVDIENNLGLGTWWWANLNSTTSGWNDYFKIEWNSVRFGPRARYPMFRAFCWESLLNEAKQYTDPSLIIGRQLTNDVFSLVRAGSVNNLSISNNFITTVPASQFDETGTVGITNRWRLLEKYATRSGASCEENPANYAPSLNLRMGVNSASLYAQDFYEMVPLSTGGFETNATTASFPLEQALRPVLSDMYLGPFYNFGRICRVIPKTTLTTRTYQWETGPATVASNSIVDAVLDGALEVSLGQPEVGTQWVKIPARLVEQKMRGFESFPKDSGGIWLTVSGLTNWSGYQVAAGYDPNEFTIPVNTATHGELILTAYHDPAATNEASGQFSEYRVAYARGTLPIGAVVSVRPVISVAQDRREGGVQEGRIRFERTGSLATNLTVNVSLSEVGGRRPATLGTDYSLIVSGLGSISASGTSATVSFPTNVAAVEVRVIPVADQVIEREHAWFTVLPGSSYAVSGSRSKASVYIYDGPKWTLFELTHTMGCDDEPAPARLKPKPAERLTRPDDPQWRLLDASELVGVTRGAGVSGAVGAQGQPTPTVAANLLVQCTYPNPQGGGSSVVSGELGARWNYTSTAFTGHPTFLFDAAIPPYMPIVTGVSDAASPLFSGYRKQSSAFDRALKAWQGSAPGNPSSWVYLPIPGGGSWLAEKNRALCISPNGTYIGGYATRTQSSPAVQEQMGVFWSGSTMTSLFAEVALNVARVGEARAVNNSGEFVGSRTLANSVGFFIPKAYRSRAGGAEVVATDFLIPPYQEGVTLADVPSQALAVSERSGTHSGVAVGWAGRGLDGEWLKRPAVWWARTNNSPEPTNAFWVPIVGAVDDESTGQANAISAGGVLYGWVKVSLEEKQRAARWENGWTANSFLDDKIQAYGYSDEWELEEFLDATNTEVIIGNGRKNGSPRAFLLVPQSVQN